MKTTVTSRQIKSERHMTATTYSINTDDILAIKFTKTLYCKILTMRY